MGEHTYEIGTDAALAAVLCGENVYISGPGGTGKTHLLQDIQSLLGESCMVVAPTGVAALNAGGVTAHRAFDLSAGVTVPEDFTEIRSKTAKPLKSKALRTLVIDEVSMVRADKFVEMDKKLQHLRKSSEPFGGLQVIMFGDFYQAQPVISTQEREDYYKYWDTDLCFYTQSWKDLNLKCVALVEQFRQESIRFATMLNCVREGRRTGDVVKELNSRCYHGGQASDAIILCSTNKRVEEINREFYDCINGKERMYKGTLKGKFPPNQLPVEDLMCLKVGMKVMIVANDLNPNHKVPCYVNGSRGTILKFYDDKVDIELDDGTLVTVPKKLWESYEYKPSLKMDWKTRKQKKVIERITTGSFEQLPLKSGYAYTIHKCVAEDSKIKTPLGMVSIADINVGDYVHTGLDGYNIVTGKVFSGWKDSITFTTRTGSELTCSPDHKVYVIDKEGGARFVEARNVTKDMRIAKSVDPYVGAGGSDYAYFLGMLIGDGNYSEHGKRGFRVELTGVDPETHAEFVKSCEMFGAKYTTRVRQTKNKKTPIMGTYTHDKGFRIFLKEELGLDFVTHQNKSIPSQVFGWDEYHRWEVVSGLWDTDGTVKGVCGPRYVTTSGDLAFGLKDLLASLGVTCSISYQNNSCCGAFTVLVHKGYNLEIFEKGINLRVPHKRDALKEAVSRFKAVGSKCKSEIDVIPPVRCGERGGMLRKTGRIPCLEHYGEIPGVLQYNFMWDEIVSIEATGEVPMYDIEVEGSHTFTVDNLIVHNCQGLTLDAYNLDLGKRGAFAAGMTYVALSRAKKIQSITLLRPVRESDIIVDPRVIQFYADTFPGLDEKVRNDLEAKVKKGAENESTGECG